ncbi:MAG: hypothetical protein IPM49_00665 [Flavobacteriales bacterium]|nr:hypothetical protein [Flavobacteriales bacterium]
MSGHPYLNGHRWLDLTRDERFFCAELYQALKEPANLSAFIHRIQAEVNKHGAAHALEGNGPWEVGFEVAFYRDLIHALGHQGAHAIGTTGFSRKRTFDLCLFGPKHLVIIEAKAHEGLATEQMNEFRADREAIRSLLGDQAPTVLLVGLWSSTYTPRTALPQASVDEAERVFDGALHWRDLITLPALTDDARRLFALADATKTRTHGQVPGWSAEGTAVSWRPVAQARS